MSSDFEEIDALNEPARRALREQLLALADTKLLLGHHCGEWTFRAPELEASIAACNIAQDEWGHTRLLYGILERYFGETADTLLHERSADTFTSVSALDGPLEGWPHLVAVSFLVDAGVTLLLQSMIESSFRPLRDRIGKMLQEERYHLLFGEAWAQSLAAKSPESRDAISSAVETVYPSAISWFGPPDSEHDAALVELGIKGERDAEIAQKLRDRVERLADTAGLSRPADGEVIDWSGWRSDLRRSSGGGPKPLIVDELRGRKNVQYRV